MKIENLKALFKIYAKYTKIGLITVLFFELILLPISDMIGIGVGSPLKVGVFLFLLYQAMISIIVFLIIIVDFIFGEGIEMKKLYRIYIVFPNGNRFRNARLFKKGRARRIKKQAEQVLKDTPCWVEIEELEV